MSGAANGDAIGPVRALVMGFVLLQALAAQETLRIQGPEPAVALLGDIVRLYLEVEGDDAAPRRPRLPDVDGLDLQLSGPTRRESVESYGGRMVRTVGVRYVVTMRPQRVGSFVVPSFPIWTGTRTQMTGEQRFEVREAVDGAAVGWLDVEVEPRRVYVHEPIRVRVDFGVLHGVRIATDVHDRYRHLDLDVQAAWLSEFPVGERIEAPTPSGPDVQIALCNDDLIQVDYERVVERDAKRWHHFSFERAFLPTVAGRVELAAPVLRLNVLRDTGRTDVFGRVRNSSEELMVRAEPVSIEVLPIPETGRPTPYYGAVGRFAIEAKLDRDAVRVAESVKLTLTIVGQGNLEFLRLPELADLDGFHQLGSVEPVREHDRVVVTYDLSPLSADVHEVPAIRWNYFDTTPGVEAFVEVATEPLPLQVRPLAVEGGLPALPEPGADAVRPGVDDIFDLPPLDGEPVRFEPMSRWLGWVAVVLPWLLVGVAFVAVGAVRRARADVDGRRVRGAAKRFERALAAGQEPLDALAQYLADRLCVAAAAVITPELAARLQAAGLAVDAARATAQLVQRGTDARYGGGAAVTAAEARAAVATLEGASFGARVRARLIWLPLLLSVVVAGRVAVAQSGDAVGDGGVAAAVKAYRAGDYERAEQGFAVAYEGSSDRRLLWARGNCLFRLGRDAEARWAYESARLGLPRDRELAANLRVLRRRLGLPDTEPDFVGEVQAALISLRPAEQLWGCAVAMLAAAALLVFGWRRTTLRWVGAALLLPTTPLAIYIVLVAPSLRPQAVALEPLALTAEPRADLPKVATVRAGALVELAGRDEGRFVLVEAAGRKGYAPASCVRVVE